MSIYQFKKTGLIDEVTFRTNEKGSTRAYLHASAGTGLSQLRTVIQTLHEHTLDLVPSILNGKPVLEVRGYNRDKELIAILNEHEWVQGEPHVYKEKTDQHTLMDILRKRSLQASGVAMAAADIGFTVYGFKESKLHKRLDPHHKRDMREALAGLSYLSGSTVLTLYGRNDQSQDQIREMANLILDEARAKGYNIPRDSAAASLSQERSQTGLQKVNEFFRQNPSEIGNMMYVAAGGLIASSALQNRALSKPRANMTAKQISEMRKGGWGDTMLGTSTVASGLLATLVKEKAHDPDTPKTHGWQAIKEWVEERPLTIAGIGYIASTMCHAFTTYTDRKEAIRAKGDIKLSALEREIAGDKLKAIPWRRLYIGMTLLGELLLTISSKGHGEGVVSDNSVDSSSIAVAAELIACQPVKDREYLVQYMGKFLGGNNMLAMKDDQVVTTLREQVAALGANPWVQCHSAPEPIPMPQPKSSNPSWQTKLNTESLVIPQLSV